MIVRLVPANTGDLSVVVLFDHLKKCLLDCELCLLLKDITTS